MDEAVKRVVSNEIVRDENGKRRFHGAFTGGFAAGYFNTVGSAEGWKPSEFKSSRTNRGQIKQRTAQDYMDEEDDPMLSSKLQAKKEFDTFGKSMSKSTYADDENSIIPNNILADLLIPSTNSVGKKLLQTMGWKEGQGIGPRLTAEEKGYKEEEYKNHTYARENVEIEAVKVKTDQYGIGYVPLLRTQMSKTQKQSQRTTQSINSKNKIMKMSDIFSHGSNGVSTGFGIGALEVDDDLDVYEDNNLDDYDKELFEPKDIDKKMKKKKKEKKRKHHKHSKNSSSSSNSDSSDSDNINDKCLIEGFVKSHKKDHRFHRYKPIPAPVGWIPHHEFASPLILSPFVKKLSMIVPEQFNEGITNNKDINDKYSKHNLTINIADMKLNFVPAKTKDEDIIMSSNKIKDNDNDELNNMDGDVPKREERVWKPCKLLCMRFNIPDPYDSQPLLGDNNNGDNNNNMGLMELVGGGNIEDEINVNQRPANLLDLLDHAEDTTIVDPLLQTSERPSVDLFKDIFGS